MVPFNIQILVMSKLTFKKQTSRRQKYFTGHSVWWRAIFHRTESKFAGPKSLSEILTNKSEIIIVATFLALANTIILRHAVSSLKKLLARFLSLLLLWQKNLWDVFICIPLFRGLAQLRPFFLCNQFQTCFGPYTTTRIVLFVHTCMS